MLPCFSSINSYFDQWHVRKQGLITTHSSIVEENQNNCRRKNCRTSHLLRSKWYPNWFSNGRFWEKTDLWFNLLNESQNSIETSQLLDRAWTHRRAVENPLLRTPILLKPDHGSDLPAWGSRQKTSSGEDA